MKPWLFRVILPVTDIEQAAAFYGKLLDFPGQRISAGRHYFSCEGTILACYDPRADGDAESLSPNADHLYFAVTDLEQTFRLAGEAGARFSSDGAPGGPMGGPMGEIATRPWGERSFYIQDPFGNRLCFVDRATVFTGE